MTTFIPSRNNDVEVFTLAEFKEKFDLVLKAHLDKKIASYISIIDNQISAEIVKHAASLVIVGGKRIRPYMTYLAYRTLGGTDIDCSFRIGVALELFHTFALIHDDIIDRGTTRHGIQTTHEFGKDKAGQCPTGDAHHVGESMAILAGDLLFSWSSEIVGQTESLEVKRIYNRMIDEVVAGQMLDVSLMLSRETTGETLDKKNELKTARYTFVNPLYIGEAMANKSIGNSFFEKFGLLLGLLFQIQDDLLDVVGRSDQTGKETFLDVASGQHTYLSQYVFLNGTANQKKILYEYFGKPVPPHAKEILMAMFRESGAVAYAENKVAEYATSAQMLLMDATLVGVCKKRFSEVLEMLLKRKK